MNASDILDSRRSWLRLAIALTASVVGSAGLWSIVVVMPAIEAEFGLTRAGTSAPFMLTMLGFAVGNLVIGRAVDRYGLSKALIVAAIVVAIAFSGAALAPSFLWLCVVQVIIGFAAAAGFAPVISDISHWFYKRRGIAVALAASGNYLAGAIWPIVLSGMMANDGWRAVYLTLAGLTVVIVIPLALLLREKLPEGAGAHAEAQATARTHGTGLSPRMLQALLALAGLSCCVAMSMPQVHIVSFCVDLGYGPAVGAEMLSLMLAGGVVSRLISGALADKLGGARTVLIGSALQCLALFLYLPFDGMVSLYIVSTIFGLSQGGIVPGYAIIIREYMPAREAGARVGFVMMMTVLGMALGGWMSGWIYDITGSYSAAFLNGIAWNGLNILIVLFVLMRSRARPTGAVPA
ncbi:MFS transporter [Actibacterium mucosum KCTC 23349]|uniref:MFS transporter n=1 Tax=Actibacterium mucosum KCTC 23349 TaxID=1454373 RepID=A0A037ZIR4_9RHOB|nr:MFS transporter [Actibacterium mucosum]KAJ55993.1 MFS transporter [Actibacterium mucosum KCTC 23349]